MLSPTFPEHLLEGDSCSWTPARQQQEEPTEMRAMRAYGDEFVVVSVGAQPEDLTEITINCPDKVGLGCDIARIVFEFGLTIRRGGIEYSHATSFMS
jgi:hypothetical protein